MKSLFGKKGFALPGGSGGVSEAAGLPDGAMAGLPARLQQMVERELCPGETVERVILPSRAIMARARRSRLIQFGAAALLAILCFWFREGPFAVWPVIWMLASLAAIGNSDLRRQRGAYVMTNQRCFHLVHTGGRVVVRDVPAVVADPRLDPADRQCLEERVAAMAAAGRMARQRTPEERRVARDLPPRLRRAVEDQLVDGETLLWADRPGVREHLLLAPLDVQTAGLGLAAGLSSVFLAPLTATFGAADWFHASVGIAAGLWGATILRLWRQVRGTVYAVTDRGGFVLAPGGRMRSFSLAEMHAFQRTQNIAGRGTLAPDLPSAGTGFYGVRDVKTVDDLIKGRATRDQSTEVTPAEALAGRGDEVAAAGDGAGSDGVME
jgi:hypothetical protein